MADGEITLEGPTKTSGVVRAGAQIISDINMEVIEPDGTITLNVRPQWAQWTTTKLLANVINQDRRGFVDSSLEIARAIDARTVVIQIPEPELDNPANFIGDILAIQLDGSLLNLPAVVQVNEKKGTIVVTGNVTISGVLISSKNLTIQTVTPPVTPTSTNPQVQRTSWGRVGQPQESSVARLDDLLQALRALDMPASEQIALLKEIHKTGRLHAAFVVE